MKYFKISKISVLLVCIIFLAMNSSCSHKEMSDQDFMKITTDLSMAMVGEAFKNDKKDFEKIEMIKLDEICKKYGYTRGDYEYKAKQLGKDLKDLYK